MLRLSRGSSFWVATVMLFAIVASAGAPAVLGTMDNTAEILARLAAKPPAQARHAPSRYRVLTSVFYPTPRDPLRAASAAVKTISMPEGSALAP